MLVLDQNQFVSFYSWTNLHHVSPSVVAILCGDAATVNHPLIGPLTLSSITAVVAIAPRTVNQCLLTQRNEHTSLAVCVGAIKVHLPTSRYKKIDLSSEIFGGKIFNIQAAYAFLNWRLFSIISKGSPVISPEVRDYRKEILYSGSPSQLCHSVQPVQATVNSGY